MRLLEALLRRRAAVLACWLAVAALAAAGLPRLRFDNSPEAYFLRDAAALERYGRFAETFGDPRGLRVVASGPGLWTPEGLAWLDRMERELPRLPGAVAASGLAGRHRAELGEWPPDDPAAFRERALATPLDRAAGWVGRDGASASVLVALRRLTPGERRRLLAEVEKTTAASAPEGVEIGIVGLEVLNRALDEGLMEVAFRFFPLVAALAVALLGLVFRSAGAVARPLLLAAYSMVVTFGAMGWAGTALDMVTTILPPLLFVIALANGLHVQLRHRRLRRDLEAVAATLETYREKCWPLLWTGVTTGAAFGSLALSAVPPVRALGLWAAFGLGVVTLASFTLYPAFLASGREEPEGSFERRSRAWGRRLGELARRRRRTVLLGFAALALVLLGGLPRLRSETGVLFYLRPSHPVRVAVESAETAGIGVASADLVIWSAEPLVPSDPAGEEAGLRRLERLAARLRAEPPALGALSASEVEAVRRERREAGLPTSGFLGTARAMLLSEDGRRARIALSIPLLSYARLEGLFARAVESGTELYPAAEVWVTGRYPLVLAAQRTLFRTMIQSLAVTLLVVALVLRLAVGGLRLLALALLPNLWPVAFVLGLMGWLEIPVDSGSVMVAAVVLGLAVDDSLHFLGRFRGLAAIRDRAAATAVTLEETAGAHVLTSLVLAAGFAACAFSSLVPVSRFGALAAAAILAALAADLLLLPALLSGAGPRALEPLAQPAGVRAADEGLPRP